jgi:hypothetical protein
MRTGLVSSTTLFPVLGMPTESTDAFIAVTSESLTKANTPPTTSIPVAPSAKPTCLLGREIDDSSFESERDLCPNSCQLPISCFPFGAQFDSPTRTMPLTARILSSYEYMNYLQVVQVIVRMSDFDSFKIDPISFPWRTWSFTFSPLGK